METEITAEQIKDLKARIDCRDVIRRDLGEPKNRSQVYNAYKCPLHHETKGQSLVVYADRWKCHGKCQASGDAISWLQTYHHMRFVDAVHALCSNLGTLPPRSAPVVSEKDAHPPSAEWQHVALRWVQRAQEYLWSTDGREALGYLINQRRLSQRYIREFRLGYIPGNRSKPYEVKGIGWIYPGWVIPWFMGGDLWAVNVRRADGPDDGKNKYILMSGSRRAGAIFNADSLPTAAESKPVLFTEGEFDTIIGAQCVDDWFSVVTLGSAGAKLHRRWYSRLLYATEIYMALDTDEAGINATNHLSEHSMRMKPARLPQGKDLSEFYASQSPPAAAVMDWLIDVTRTS